MRNYGVAFQIKRKHAEMTGKNPSLPEIDDFLSYLEGFNDASIGLPEPDREQVSRMYANFKRIWTERRVAYFYPAA